MHWAASRLTATAYLLVLAPFCAVLAEDLPFEVPAWAFPGHPACACCHLPDGTGRPENAALAGCSSDAGCGRESHPCGHDGRCDVYSIA